jgi:hypothetical protein
MLEITRRATFTDAWPEEALTTIVARSVLEAALAEDEPGQLWFEVESDDDSRRVSIDMSTADLEELLRLAGSGDVALTLGADDVEGLFDEPDVEAHGMKGAIAIAVASAALLAPAGQAAVTQSVEAQSTTQRAGAATSQVAQVSTQVSNAAATVQVASVQAKLAKSNAAKLRSFNVLRGGFVR